MLEDVEGACTTSVHEYAKSKLQLIQFSHFWYILYFHIQTLKTFGPDLQVNQTKLELDS